MEEDRPFIVVNGEVLAPDPLGALFWPSQETLIVSDLHFEKGSSFAERGILLPPYDTRTTLQRIKALLGQYQPRRVISLGDAFHDEHAETRMQAEDTKLLQRCMVDVEWVWILGNHDPAPPKRFAGSTEQELALGPLVFRHEPLAGDAPGEIAGHLHPCARVVHEGRTLRRRCFASDGARLIMPALGAYTGGLNLLDDAFLPHFQRVTAWVMGEKSIYPVSHDKLAPDGPNIERNSRPGIRAGRASYG
ncbi:MAG: metallophosphatase [Hyphococcus sp.]|nr:MAG: metallophosphatase [Marinicaulis sp.]